MAAQAGVADAAPAPAALAAPSGELRVRLVDEGPAPAAGAHGRARRTLWRAGLIHAGGGLVYGLVMTVPWMLSAGGGFILSRWLWLWTCYAWPAALALALVAATGRRQRAAIAAGYFAFLAGAAAYGLARNPELSVGQLAYFWLFVNAPGTLLLLAFLGRRVRAVGPLVLAFMTAGVTGALVLVQVAGASESFLRGLVAAGTALGLGATELFVLMHLAGFALLAAVGWRLLRWLGSRYRAKRLSDQSLTLDALWLLFAVVQSITLTFEGWPWIFTGLAAFAARKPVVNGGFALRPTPAGAAPMLLLLRVFALGGRSERLFDVLNKYWLRHGSIGLIAGPDLVTATVEPHEFLDFVAGGLARRFVSGAADLDRRLAQLDTRPDPDGRHRVNEFFCRADTWQMTMTRLAALSDAVLMDLRGFAPTNQGCRFELGRLLQAVPLERVLLLMDESSDLPFLERSLHELWQQVDAGSPNRAAPAPEVRLLRLPDLSAAALGRLLARVFSLHGERPAARPGLVPSA